jgi:hypothetical protein
MRPESASISQNTDRLPTCASSDRSKPEPELTHLQPACLQSSGHLSVRTWLGSRLVPKKAVARVCFASTAPLPKAIEWFVVALGRR